MGAGRPRNLALERPAVTQFPVRGASLGLSLSALLLSGCSSVGAISGAVAGASTGAISANPIVGYATAVGVNAGISALQKHLARAREHKKQTQIASVAGTLQPGDTLSWKVSYINPFFANHHGEVKILRTIDTPLAQCKMVLFTLDAGSPTKITRTPFTTAICHDTAGWRWAMAEPATRRWGFFQHVAG
jgi:hypothetical protein